MKFAETQIDHDKDRQKTFVIDFLFALRQVLLWYYFIGRWEPFLSEWHW